MAKKKKKLTAAQKRVKKKRRKEYMTIFVNGKQKRVKRPPTIDGMDVDEFIKNNADPIWLHHLNVMVVFKGKAIEIICPKIGKCKIKPM